MGTGGSKRSLHARLSPQRVRRMRPKAHKATTKPGINPFVAAQSGQNAHMSMMKNPMMSKPHTLRLLPLMLACLLAIGCGDAPQEDTNTDNANNAPDDVNNDQNNDDNNATNNDDGDIDPIDDGEIVGECGQLPEGLGQCLDGPNLQICESGQLVQYECPQGSVCGQDNTTVEGVGCFCDDLSDGLCPDEACTNDPDCAMGPAVCDFAQDSYPGTLTNAAAFEGNSNTPAVHFLSLLGDLNGDPQPDRLSIAAFYSVGVETGVFENGNGPWVVKVVRDASDGFPSSQGDLLLQSGTLSIDSVEGSLTGTLTDAVFADEDDPNCTSTIDSVTFDLPIEIR